MISAAKKYLKEFDIIHVHEYRTFQNLVVHHYAEKYGLHYILQAHGSLPRNTPRQGLKWMFDVLFGHRILKSASTVIALNHAEARQYRNMGVPERKIRIIPNGIDLSEYSTLPCKGCFKKKFNIPEDKKIVLYLGRIHETKGIDLLVRAHAYLSKSIKPNDVLLIVAGPDDGYFNQIKSLVDSLGMSGNVLFTGFINNEDKLRALVDAEVLVSPSFFGFPITFLEACAVGVPIVSSNMGDTLDWIDNNVGYVVPPTPEDLAMAMYKILTDNELHEVFSRNCREIVRKRFSIERVVDELEVLYQNTANFKGGT
jgi:glycosyltransferase involved in cell wall biosynthesis